MKCGLHRAQTTASRTRVGLLFAMPWIIGFLGFQIYPLLCSAYYGFTEFNAVRSPKWVGIANYVNLWNDKLFGKSLSNTLIYTGVMVPVFLTVSLLLALLIKEKLAGRTVFRTVFFLPTIVPIVAAMMVWVRMFNPSAGIINSLLRVLGISGPLWLADAYYAKLAIMIITLWGSVGTTMIIFLAALQEVPDVYYEAARIDGAGAYKQFFSITLPCIAHIFVYQSTLCMINCFQIFTQPYVVATLASGWGTSQRNPGGPQNSLLFYSVLLYQNAFKYLKMGKASAMGWILFLLISILSLIIFRYTRRFIDNGIGSE